MRLNASDERYRLLFELSPDGIATFDIKGVVSPGGLIAAGSVLTDRVKILISPPGATVSYQYMYSLKP